MTARTPYSIRKIATRVTVEGSDVKHVQHSQDNFWWTKWSWVGAWKWAV